MRFVIVMLFLFVGFAAQASQLLSVEAQYDKPVITLHFKGKPQYKMFVLKAPDRYVVDLQGVKLVEHFDRHAQRGIVKTIRVGGTAEKKRLVFDLHAAPKTHRASLSHASDKPEHYRLEITLDAPLPVAHSGEFIPIPVLKKRPYVWMPVPHLRPKKPLIVIDPGHGGKDPGALSNRGKQEKYVTLTYGKDLRDALLKTGKYRVKMTRSNDRYITLGGRVAFARKHQADLFISLHADSHPNKRVKGLSIYTLSDRASDREAARLAKQENAIADIEFGHRDKELEAILIDLAQRDTKNQSVQFASLMVNNLRKEVDLLGRPHRFAGFRVLTAPDIPSVLVELGYLSNRKEESRLRSKKYRKKMIKAIVEAVEHYFE